jgi:diguanylate cyclase (GGDEF)-like protein
VKEALDCFSVVAAVGDEIDGYVTVGAAGIDAGFLGFRQPPSTGLGGRAVQTGRVLVTHRYHEDGYAPHETSALAEVQSSIAAPLRWDDAFRAFVSAGFKTAKPIATTDVELMEGFAELAGLACANAERHARVQTAAEVDGLTGCLNRDALEVRLSEAIHDTATSGDPLSVALIDLDRFKAINDVFGHPTGDTVLRSVGQALRSSLRAGDLVARYGGDEFALILANASERQAQPVIDRVRAAISSLDVPGGKVTACVGVAEHTAEETPLELVRRADNALREAKLSVQPGSMRRAARPAAGPGRGSKPAAWRRHRWRAVAGDIGLGIARCNDLDDSTSFCASELYDNLELSGCAVLRVVAGGELMPIATVGEQVGEKDGAMTAAERALHEKRPMIGDHATGRRGSDIENAEAGRARRGGEIAVPLIVNGRPWGAIHCLAPPDQLDGVDAELVMAVGEHLSAAIRTSDLHEQLTESMIGTAESLAAALEAKDSYTADHARSISELAVEVGHELSLPEALIEDLRYAGIFHDVGKIAVPDSLINKAGPLSEEEWEIVREHPVAGAEILAPVPFLYGVRTIVRHAHEHWDGGGYPDGLAGAQIPLGARIVLAADAYHAMTSDRPYRARKSEEEARAELVDNSGTQFDPEVVEALLSVLERRAAAADG